MARLCTMVVRIRIISMCFFNRKENERDESQDCSNLSWHAMREAYFFARLYRIWYHGEGLDQST